MAKIYTLFTLHLLPSTKTMYYTDFQYRLLEGNKKLSKQLATLECMNIKLRARKDKLVCTLVGI